jgi:hypothetical protein
MFSLLKYVPWGSDLSYTLYTTAKVPRGVDLSYTPYTTAKVP